MEQKEFILCAAIWINDNKIHAQQPDNIHTGFVICGRRHHNCYQTITDLKGDYNEYFKSLDMSDEDYKKLNGFITSHDRYVTRKEAFKIAKDNNQIVFGHCFDNDELNILISEHLY
jgi:hypothetical protein